MSQTETERRIVLVSTALRFGGAEIQVLQLARHLRARGWDVHLVSMVAPEAFTAELAEFNVRLHSLEMEAGRPDPRALFRLASLIRSIRPRILHSHMVHANILTRLTRLLTWTPVCISTIHTADDGGRIWQWGYRLTDPLCDLTTHVSRLALRRYIGIRAVPERKMRHVPNGIDTERFKPRPTIRARVREGMGFRDEFVWLAVGRFEPPKDYGNLLNAFQSVYREDPTCVLLLVGEGPEDTFMRKWVKERGLEGTVRFLGLRRDVPDLMNAADAFVMSSRREGLPLVLLEAAASGLPIVTTDVGGTREIVEHEETGFVTPPLDSDALSEGMVRMLRLPHAQRLTLGRNGRLHVTQTYTIGKVMDQWEALYTGLN
jgi:glycosyltransferase involved in cell wall biosynthesis